MKSENDMKQSERNNLVHELEIKMGREIIAMQNEIKKKYQERIDEIDQKRIATINKKNGNVELGDIVLFGYDKKMIIDSIEYVERMSSGYIDGVKYSGRLLTNTLEPRKSGDVATVFSGSGFVILRKHKDV